jgi:hypothetical protein
MSANLNFFDRWFRLIIGCLMLAWAIAGGPAWAYIGFYLLASGAAKVCIFYALFENRNRTPRP